MIILGIESTCDETGVALVEDGVRVIKNVLASSVDLQKKYGGVVPEVAAREQIKVIIPVIDEALNDISIKQIDAIAISHGPGLIGSLLIGVETAKTLALAWQKPLIPVNHLVGHIYANWISLEQKPKFPLIGLVVSGGHTDLILMRGHGEFKLIGTTLDDSAGEAFDKVARLLDLPYPGGPEIERVARQLTVDGSQLTVKLPRPMIGSGDYNFSFSGLKTAVVNFVHSNETVVHSKEKKSVVADEFQNAIVDVLITKSLTAAKKFSCESIVVGGGVAANSHLRSKLTTVATRDSIKVFFPSKSLSVDNGAMIAAAAYFINKKVDPLKLSANPSLHF